MDYKTLENRLHNIVDEYPRNTSNIRGNIGTNFLTPWNIRTFAKGQYIVEVAYGQGFGGGYMIGVTLWSKGNGAKSDKSKSFHSDELLSLEEFIQEL